MKPFSRLFFVAIFAIFACSGGGGNVAPPSGPLHVTSIADVALGYLIETDSGQFDSASISTMKRMRRLDQDFRSQGTGECNYYQIMSSCLCMCGSRCCYCTLSSGPIFMAGSPAITSLHIAGPSSPSASYIDTLGVRIFSLNVGTLRGNVDLVIDYDSVSFSLPVTIGTDSLKVRIP